MAPPLLVRTDRARLDRLWRWAVGVQAALWLLLIGVIALLVTVVATSGAGPGARAGLAPLVVPLAMGGLAVWLSATTWRGLRAIDTPLEVHGTGLVARTVHGEVVAPWDALSEVRLVRHWTGARLRVRFVSRRDPRAAGLRWAMRGRFARRVAERQGLLYAMRVLAVEPAVLATAVSVHSQGRFRPVA